MLVKVAGAAVAGVVLAVFLHQPADTPSPHVEVRDASPVAAELIDEDYPGPGLLALRQWTPTRNTVLICQNYDQLLPMRPADLWVTATVPASGRVLIVASAATANSEPNLGDYWGVMVGDEVVATAQVGTGDTPHRVMARFVVEDLPAGEEVRFDIAHRSDVGGTANLFLGPTYGPAVIEVWSA